MIGLPPWLIHALDWGIVWLAVLAALVVFFLVRTHMRRAASRKYSGEGPFCRACGYSLKVRTSDHCPECGAKLTLQRAIRPAGQLAPLPWQVRIIVVALITAYPFVLPFYIIDANDKMQDWFYGYEAFEMVSPASDQYYKVVINAQWFHVGTWTTGTLTAQLLGVRGVHHPTDPMTVSLPALRATFEAKGESRARQRTPIDSAFVLDWMGEQGVAVDAPGVQAEADLIRRQIEHFSSFGYGVGRYRYGPVQSTYPIGFTVFLGSAGPPWKPWDLWWYWPAAIIVISAIWIILALLLRRHLNRAARRLSLPATPSAVH
jgi:hypothetical protein